MQPHLSPREDVQDANTCVIARAADRSGCTFFESPCTAPEPTHTRGRRTSDVPPSAVREKQPQSGAERCAPEVSSEVLKRYLFLVNQVVSQIARRLPPNVLRDDLLSAGICGLLDSLRRNGGDEGDTFEWYARMRIRGAVVDELRAQDWLSRRRRAALASGKEDGCRARPTALVSLAELTPEEESTFLVAEAQDPVAMLETRDAIRRLRLAMEKLPDRERTIMALLYFGGKKLKEIGATLNISEPRVSQLHSRALDRLRQIMLKAA